ncbi:SCAN domaincontaining protein 3like [Nephila pilipes]|uniref:SCAN domaincontaining protein 3like n=1 Tax=Nephila pilipes TaxID=299642 RepID=A0A8X6PE66_NEPPI|nr:SCAN domaincontaining protein 3like [Nephila pilipes]
MVVDLFDISDLQYQEELAKMQNDASVKLYFNMKGVMAWLCEEDKIKYTNATKCARELLLPFPSSYLTECGFIAMSDLPLKRRNRLVITKWGDSIGTRNKISLQPTSKAMILLNFLFLFQCSIVCFENLLTVNIIIFQ